MIPASYLFKDVYRQHWEVDTASGTKPVLAASVPPILPKGGLMRATAHAWRRLVHLPRPAEHAGFGL